MRRSFTGIPEMVEGYRTLGPLRFLAIMAGLLAYTGISAWLAFSLDYPRSYGSSCHSKCMIENYWYSLELLRHGGYRAYALFACLWSMPALVGGAIIYARLKRRRDPLSTKITSE